MKDPRQMTHEEAIAEVEMLRRSGAATAEDRETAMRRHAEIISETLRASGAFPVAPDDEDRDAGERQYAIQQIHAAASTASKLWTDRCIAEADERLALSRDSLAEYRINNEIMERIAVALNKIASRTN